MGTRADFYIGRGEQAEWIGSTAWDGYPNGICLTKAEKRVQFGIEFADHEDFPAGAHLFDAVTEQEFRERVAAYFRNREDVTLPADGWPWPWDDSRTTDYAYALDGGKVWASCFGHDWFDPRHEPEDDDQPTSKTAVFPNMKDRQRVTMGKRSGVIVIGG